MRIRILLLLSIFLTSCTSTKLIEDAPINYSEGVIYFLVFNISQDTALKNSTIHLTSKINSVGEIKNNFQEHIDSENYLKVEVYDKDLLINTIIIEHPLYKNIEYFDEEKLSTKFIELDSADFFIRLQVNNPSNVINISEVLNHSTPVELLKIKL
ncbi:MAG TPA: hypothetical protein VLZ75_09865 [Chitinophagales bacterium]|nr:hypothetical protein [Chitinophagales bacterium]